MKKGMYKKIVLGSVLALTLATSPVSANLTTEEEDYINKLLQSEHQGMEIGSSEDVLVDTGEGDGSVGSGGTTVAVVKPTIGQQGKDSALVSTTDEGNVLSSKKLESNSMFFSLEKTSESPHEDFKLVLKNTNTGANKTVEVTEKMFSNDTLTYEIEVKDFKIKTGDALVVTIDTDKRVKSLNVSILGHHFDIKEGKYMYFKATSYKSYDANDKLVDVLTGAKNAKIRGSLVYDTYYHQYAIKDQNGSYLANKDVTIKDVVTGTQYKGKTDKEGVLLVPKDKVQNEHEIVVPDYGTISKDGILNFEKDNSTVLLDEIQVSLTDEYYEGQLQNDLKEDLDKNYTHYDVILKTDYDVRLSTAWMTANVKTDKGAEFHIDRETRKLSIPKGSKITSVTSEYATVESHNISGNTLTVKLKPKYTLIIDNNGKGYNVTIENAIPALTLTGSKVITFGVMPSDNFIIKNNDTDEAVSVLVNEGNKSVEFDSTYGITKGKGANNPHTNTWITLVTIVLILAVVLFFVLRSVNNRKKLKKLGNIFTILVLLLSTILIGLGEGVKVEASGSNIGGTGSGDGDASNITVGNHFQIQSHLGIAEMYFVDASALGSNKEKVLSKTASSLDSTAKYDYGNRKYALYLALDAPSYELANKSSSGVSYYDMAEANPNARFKGLRGYNSAVSVIRETGASKGNDLIRGNSFNSIASRLITPYHTVKSAPEATNEFVKAITSGLRVHARSSSNTLYSISGGYLDKSISSHLGYTVKPYGQAIADYINRHYMGDTTQAKNKREKLINDYASYLIQKGVVSSVNDTYIKNLKDRFAKGELVLMINTLFAAKASNKTASNGTYTFMTLHDYAKWLKDIWNRGSHSHNASLINAAREHKAVDTIYQKKNLRYANWAQPTYTSLWLQMHYAHSLQPATSVLPTSQSSNTQPYGGWGYAWFGKTAKQGSVIKGRVRYHVPKDDGSIGKIVKEEPVAKWNGDLGIPYTDVRYNEQNQKVRTPLEIFVKNGEVVTNYEYDKEKNAQIVVRDEKASANTCSIPGGQNLANKKNWLDKNEEGQWLAPINRELLESQELVFLQDYLDVRALNVYIGNSPYDPVLEGVAVNKYSMGANKKESDICYGNIDTSIYIPVKEVGQDVSGEYILPQWSLSEYYEDVPNTYLQGMFGKGSVELRYTVPANTVPELTLGGWIRDSLLVELTGTQRTVESKSSKSFDWIDKQDRVVLKEQQYKEEEEEKKPLDNTSVTSSSIAGLGAHIYEHIASHDIVAYRTDKNKVAKDSGVDTIKLAEWVEGATPIRNMSGKEVITTGYKPYSAIEKYDTKVKDYNNTLSLNEKVIRPYNVKQTGTFWQWRTASSCSTNADGTQSCSSYNYRYDNPSNPIITNTPISFLSTTQDILARIHIKKYQAKDKTETKLDAEEVMKGTDFGSTALYKYENYKMKFFPEIAMKLDGMAQGGSTNPKSSTMGYRVGVQFALGEKQREVEPYHFHLAYLKTHNNSAGIKTAVSGAEATDQRANQLTNKFKLQNNNVVKPVLPKGTATTNSIDLVNSTIVHKYYFVDFKEDIFRSTWTPDLPSVESIAKTEMSRVVQDGKVKGETNSYYLIDNEKLEKTKGNITFKQKGSTVEEQYDLVIRGGMLQKAGDWTYHDLKPYLEDEALCQAPKLVTEDEKRDLACALMSTYIGVDKNGLFSMLEAKSGDIIKEDLEGNHVEFIRLANLMRGTADSHFKAVRNTINEKWYIEDTTVFTLKMQRYEYEVPAITWTAKLPLEYKNADLKTPSDNTQFYAKGAEGAIGTTIKWGTDRFNMSFDINTVSGAKGDKAYKSNTDHDYIVPNVSVLDGLR